MGYRGVAYDGVFIVYVYALNSISTLELWSRINFVYTWIKIGTTYNSAARVKGSKMWDTLCSETLRMKKKCIEFTNLVEDEWWKIEERLSRYLTTV